ncbi:MAG: hypothetical protein IPJ41_18145 [Phycisphaerales bacterium]|nr:hypothetical protein [Phycisphaerales bacterium]
MPAQVRRHLPRDARFSRVGAVEQRIDPDRLERQRPLPGSTGTAAAIRHPDGRQTVVVSIGDAIEENQLLATTIGPGEPWTVGFAVDGRGSDARSVVYERSDS